MVGSRQIRLTLFALIYSLLLTRQGLADFRKSVVKIDTIYYDNTGSSGGSGVVVKSDKDVTYIITNLHVVEPGRGRVQITGDGFKRKNNIKVWYLKRSRRRDLCLLKITVGEYPHIAKLGPKDYKYNRNKGSLLSIGYDARGTGKKRIRQESPTQLHEVYVWKIYTVHMPQPGRSGGGLFDSKTGDLVGICEARTAPPLIDNGQGIYSNTEALYDFLQGTPVGVKKSESKE